MALGVSALSVLAISTTEAVELYTAAVALTHETTTLAATGTNVAYVGTSALVHETAALAGTGTFTAPTYTGTADLTHEATTLSASGTHTAPTYTGSAALAHEAAVLAASGTHTAPTYTGSAALAHETTALAGTGTHTAPTYTGTAALTHEAAVGAAVGLFASYVGVGDFVHEVTTVSAVGAFTQAASESGLPVIVANRNFPVQPVTIPVGDQAIVASARSTRFRPVPAQEVPVPQTVVRVAASGRVAVSAPLSAVILTAGRPRVVFPVTHPLGVRSWGVANRGDPTSPVTVPEASTNIVVGVPGAQSVVPTQPNATPGA